MLFRHPDNFSHISIRLPQNDLSLTFLESKERFQVALKGGDDCLQYPMKTVIELIDSFEVSITKLCT